MPHSENSEAWCSTWMVPAIMATALSAGTGKFQHAARHRQRRYAERGFEDRVEVAPARGSPAPRAADCDRCAPWGSLAPTCWRGRGLVARRQTR